MEVSRLLWQNQERSRPVTCLVIKTNHHFNVASLHKSKNLGVKTICALKTSTNVRSEIEDTKFDLLIAISGVKGRGRKVSEVQQQVAILIL